VSIDGLPPGPPGSPGLQSFVAAAVVGASSLPLPGLPKLRSPVPGVHRLRERYGDMFTVSLPGMGRAVVVSDPELIKLVFAADEDTLHFGEGSPFGAVLGPNSLLAIDGRRHVEQRKLVMPPFHGARMHAYG
jgi:cytochrome P450